MLFYNLVLQFVFFAFGNFPDRFPTCLLHVDNNKLALFINKGYIVYKDIVLSWVLCHCT